MLIDARTRLLVFVSLLSTFPATAQQPAQPSQAQKGKITLDVVVTPKSGEPVTGLQQGDFILTDNKAARPLTSFRALTRGEAPMQLILLVDAVNTNYQHLSYERQQIESFLKSNGGKLPLPTSLVIFTDTKTETEQTASTDGNALADSLEKYGIGLREIRRDSLYGGQDRLNLSLKTVGQLVNVERARPGRKIVLWISPGWPLLSGPRIELTSKEQNGLYRTIVDLSTQMREAGITLYNVNPLGAGEDVMRASYYEEFLKGVSDPRKVDIGDLSLQVLARQSGGFVLNSSNDITGMLKKCLLDTQAYYELSFDAMPAEKPDQYHHIDVQIEKPGLTARTRDGYYAQP
jgi:VWFA-related protein